MTDILHEYAHLIARVRNEVPGSTSAIIKQTGIETFREFFRDTSSWQELIPFSTAVNVTSYPVAALQGGQIIGLFSVVDANNFPVGASMGTLGTITLTTVPNSVNAYTAAVAKNIVPPFDDDNLVNQLPNFVFVQYHEAIFAGIVGKLQNMPSKTFSNSEKAAYHLKRFRNEIGLARVAVARLNTRGTQAWRFPQDYRVNTQRGIVAVGNDFRF